MNQKYLVTLSDTEKNKLIKFIKDGTHSSGLVTRANILLAMDTGNSEKLKQKQIAVALHTSESTVVNVVKDYFNNGLDSALTYKRNPNSNAKKKIIGTQEARLIQLACSKAPDGHSRWSVDLLTKHAVRLQILDDVDSETVRRTLKKMNFDLT